MPEGFSSGGSFSMQGGASADGAPAVPEGSLPAAEESSSEPAAEQPAAAVSQETAEAGRQPVEADQKSAAPDQERTEEGRPSSDRRPENFSFSMGPQGSITNNGMSWGTFGIYAAVLLLAVLIAAVIPGRRS